MKLTIELTPEQGIRLFTAAKLTGIDLAALISDFEPESANFISQLTESTISENGGTEPTTNRDHFYFTASEEEFTTALNETSELNMGIPALPESAYDRENLYEDRW